MGVSERRELRVQDPMVHWRGLSPAIPCPYRSPRARLGVGGLGVERNPSFCVDPTAPLYTIPKLEMCSYL